MLLLVKTKENLFCRDKSKTRSGVLLSNKLMETYDSIFIAKPLKTYI